MLPKGVVGTTTSKCFTQMGGTDGVDFVPDISSSMTSVDKEGSDEEVAMVVRVMEVMMGG